MDPSTDHAPVKQVVLYNPLSGTGHFDSWCVLFASVLREAGWTVYIATPDGSAVSRRLPAAASSDRGALRIFDRHSHLPGVIPWESPFSRLLHAATASLGRLRHHDAHPAGSQTLRTPAALTRSLRKLALKVAIRVLGALNRTTRPLFNRKLSISNTSPVLFAEDVNALVRGARILRPVILNLYVDLYHADNEQWRKFRQTMIHPWVGLNIDLRNSLPAELLDYAPSLRALLYINEDTIDFPLSPSPGLEYAWIPDVATDGLPDARTALANEILRKAAGRKIVFLGGAIGGTKNLSTWYQAIRMADPGRWYFIQIGAVDQSTLTTADRLNLQQTMASPPENLLIQDRFLPDESSFNELIAISDFVWAVYRDFDRSSNLLGKAAVFRKPVIVSNRFLMGKRVREYGTGLAVSENEPSETVEALDSLAESPVPAENFDRYVLDFGHPALRRRLDETLTRVLSNA